jgi:UDP-N-acetylglucosamine 2-epimerase
VLRAVRPQAACLYAESSGWGRAALAACRTAAVPTVAVQHGILYPTYYSYLHEADEAACPRPDHTAVFGEAARRFLTDKGGYRPESLVPTGSPKFDALLAGARDRDRGALRARLGVDDATPLLVVASRFQGIRDTHRAIGTAFPGLVRAVEALGIACRVRPHPAEPAAAYEKVLQETGARRTQMAPRDIGLVDLLQASDALATVESLSAVEALVLGRPVLILNGPTNLQALVEAGVAVGVPQGTDPADALRRLLFDPDTRDALALARAGYLSDVAAGVDGRATERILALVKAAAEGHVRV